MCDIHTLVRILRQTAFEGLFTATMSLSFTWAIESAFCVRVEVTVLHLHTTTSTLAETPFRAVLLFFFTIVSTESKGSELQCLSLVAHTSRTS